MYTVPKGQGLSLKLDQRVPAEEDLVASFEIGLGNTLSFHIGAVAAAEILDVRDAAGKLLYARMEFGNGRIDEAELTGRISSYDTERCVDSNRLSHIRSPDYSEI